MKSDRISIAITIAAAFLTTIIIVTPITHQKEALAQNTTIMANQTIQNQTATNQTQLEEGRVGEQLGGTGAENVTATATTANNLATAIPDTSTATASTSNFLLYENSTYGIRIQYPYDWDLEETDYSIDDGIIDITRFFSPYEGRIDDYSESILVSKESNPVDGKNITLAAYADEVIDFYNDTLTDFNLVELNTNNITLSGFSAYKLVFTQSAENVDSSIKAMEVGTITPKQEVYFVTYYGDDNGQYTKYLPIAQRMIDSFEIVSDTAIREESIERLPPTTEPFSSSQIRNNNTITSSTNLSQVYEDPQELFTLKYPYNWEAIYKRSETSGEPTLELSGTRGASNIQVRVIESIPFAEPQDFESVFGIYPRILQGMFPNITIIGSDFGVYNVDGQKAGSVIYTLPLSSLGKPELEGINANTKGLQVMVPLSDRTDQALSITFTTLENLFEKDLPIAESIINSTKINDSGTLQ